MVLKVALAAFAVAYFWGLSDVHECSDIDTTRRVVLVLGYWYNKKSSFLEDCCQLFSSQIMKLWTLDKQLWTGITLWLILIFLTFQPTDSTNSKRLMEIQSPMKNPFSTLNPFSIPSQTVSRAWDIPYVRNFLVARKMDSRIN